MHYTYIIAGISLLPTIGGAYIFREAPKAPPPQPPVVRTIPLNTANFADRWKAFATDEPRIVYVKTQTIKVVPEPRPRPPEADTEEQLELPKAAARTQHRSRNYRHRSYSDLCQRHNRRKIYVSRHKWRCLR